MKTTVGIVLLGLAGVSVPAGLVEHDWYSGELYTYGNVESWNANPPNYDGYGWQVDIALAGSSGFTPSLMENAGTAAMFGWYDGYGYVLEPFTFAATEGEAVVMRIYNGTKGVDATRWVDSVPVVLPDIEGIPFPGDFDISFQFAPGTTWGWHMDVYTDYGTPVNYTAGIDNWICLINSPASDGGTNYACTGWVGTGDVPAFGTTINTGPFTIYQNSTLTWQWETSEYWLDVSVVGHGSVDLPDGWYPAGTNLTVAAIPDADWFFTGWCGNLSGDQSTATNNLVMNGAKSIIAHFGRAGDWDGDEIEDVWELEHFPSIEACVPTDDPDEDLYTNIEEFRNGTEPNIWDFHLVRRPAIELNWKMVPGINYQIQFKNDIATNAWNNLGDVIAGDGTTNSVLDSTQGSEYRFYRVITVP